MEITAALVKDLREMTGAGMMDCKKALTESGGDIDAAVEYLRKHGQAQAEKKASRIAAEGICKAFMKDSNVAVLVEVNSETDFVAKNDTFKEFVADVAQQIMDGDATDVDALLAQSWHKDSSKTVKDALVERIAKIGENLNIRRFAKVEASNGCLASYTHGEGKIGVIIEAKTDVTNEEIKEALLNIAMQVAALNAKYISSADVPDDYKEHEKEIILAQIKEDPKNAGKPDEIIEKMIVGRLNKELREVCLLEQVYVKAEDGKQTVASYLAQVGKENGANLEIASFVRFETGEGLDKREDDFAAEVAKQIG